MRISMKLALLAALTLGAVAAQAQETKPLGLSLRAGLFLPSDTDARNESNSWFAFGGEFKLKDLHFGERGSGYSAQLSLSVDNYSKGDFSHTPILLNYVGRTNQVFYSLGGGIGFESVPFASSSTKFAYGLGLGYDFQQSRTPVFVEAMYFGSTETKLNGFTVYVGVRL